MSSAPAPAQANRIVFDGKQQVRLEPFEVGMPGEGEVRIRTQFSLMSTGTENIVFNRLFDPDTHWDRWVKYPFYPGYSAVGVVEAAGSGSRFKAGDRIAARCPHRSHAVVTEDRCAPIPAGVPMEAAAWFALAKIAFHGARAAKYSLGDQVLVIGVGPIGQMSIRWAFAAGAQSVIAVDATPDRLELARRGGATTVISAPIAEAREQILAANGGELPGIVIDSTGNAQVFQAALGLARRFGKVVVLGDTGQPTSQALNSDVITRGITIVGAHDGHNDAQWNGATIAHLFFALVATGRFSLDGLNTHVFKPGQCVEAYRTANHERAKTLGILFDWRD